ncbi:MAG TPA: methyltransferase domain-containing protein [Bryobacteraceae bacterium]
MPDLPAHLELVRKLLRRLNYHLTAAEQHHFTEPFDPKLLERCEQALRDMPAPSPGAKAYLEKHIPRLARTLALVPPPQSTGRVLELGCYMQITPLLQRVCGYKEVCGAYYGPVGRVDRKTMSFPDGEFTCEIEHFDAERDPFPYPDGHFDLVVAGEILEHMTYDPMRLLLESHRVLHEGGYVLVTTPNIASITSIAKTLGGRDNPQIYPNYKMPLPGEEPEIGHVREYTLYELGQAVKSAGFEIEKLFTSYLEEYAGHKPLLNLLAANGFDTENRGEQSWCLALKRAALPIDRYPNFIYYGP